MSAKGDKGVIDLGARRRARAVRKQLDASRDAVFVLDHYDFTSESVDLVEGDRPVVLLTDGGAGIAMTSKDARSLAAELVVAADAADTADAGDE